MSQHEPSFGAHVRRLREARALTRQEVAKLGGLAVDTIGKNERDEVSPALRTVRRLAKGLGIKALSELFADL